VTAALWWAIAAAVLVVIEITTLDLIFAMLAAGAVAGAIMALTDQSLLVQCLVAAAVALLMLVLVRPVALRHLRQDVYVPTNVDALLGQSAVVLERVDRTHGRIKLKGEVWSARTEDDNTMLEPGRTVDVVRIDGATAIVRADVT
jgi:membrane protein implicated in regulation of membrane protease activity